MNRIRQLREELGWKQDDLAKRLNVERAAVSKYETEYVPLTADKILLLCKIFNVSSDFLLGNNDIEKTTSERQPLTAEQQKIALATSDLTTEEIEKVIDYVEFVKTKRKP